MIDRPYPEQPTEPSAGDSAEQGRSGPTDLFSDLFAPPAQPVAPGSTGGQSSPSRPARAPATSVPATKPAPTAPPSPLTLEESGLTLMQVCELVLKQLYLQSTLLGLEIARNARLPFSVIDEALSFLKDDKCIEVGSGDLLGSVSYRFNLTELGRIRAREAFEQCRYVGPAPVSIEQYVAQCHLQTVTDTPCTPQALYEAFSELIIRANLLEELGPAVCSGKSIFIYGPPGNGKTMIAKGLGQFLNTHGGEIYIPYAIHSENSIITVFDPTIHSTTDDVELQAAIGNQADSIAQGLTSQIMNDDVPDLRWRRIRRPVVITGGELTLDMLDLRYNATSNFYTAPLHIKANGGVFLIDDFGRQIVSPRDLLNRWILPLEERIDYMTLATGKKFSVPFEQLIIFSTSLDPRELVDEAFLRRIRHKIEIGSPSRDLFTDIFKLCCEQRQIPYDPAVVDYLYLNFYDRGKPPRSSDPRDLLEMVRSICRFRDQRVLLTPDIMAEATSRFFCQV